MKLNNLSLLELVLELFLFLGPKSLFCLNWIWYFNLTSLASEVQLGHLFWIISFSLSVFLFSPLNAELFCSVQTVSIEIGHEAVRANQLDLTEDRIRFASLDGSDLAAKSWGARIFLSMGPILWHLHFCWFIFLTAEVLNWLRQPELSLVPFIQLSSFPSSHHSSDPLLWYHFCGIGVQWSSIFPFIIHSWIWEWKEVQTLVKYDLNLRKNKGALRPNLDRFLMLTVNRWEGLSALAFACPPRISLHAHASGFLTLTPLHKFTSSRKVTQSLSLYPSKPFLSSSLPHVSAVILYHLLPYPPA